MCSALMEALVQRIGIQVASERQRFVAADLQRQMQRHGLDLARALDLAHSAPLDHPSLSSLVECITIGESYFFRDAEQFEQLRGRVLPQLQRDRSAARRLDIFSAGCSAGEELYTMAMVIRESLSLEHWQVLLSGGDVNSAAVEQARRGNYSVWSLRGLAEDFRERYFVCQDGRFQLRQSLRQMATFQVMNLMEELAVAPQDLIFFRNVSIYFDAEQRRQIVGRLVAALRPGGFLVVGAGELVLEVPPDLQSWGHSIYCKAAAESVLAKAAAPTRPAPRRSRPARPASKPTPAPEEIPLQRAQQAADQGRLDAAEQDCRLHLLSHPDDAAGHFLHGLVLEAAGRPEEAVRALRQALFLAPEHALAHFRLALLLRRGQESALARRHLNRAEKLLTRAGGADSTQMLSLVREQLKRV